MKRNLRLQSVSDNSISHHNVELSSKCPCCGVTLKPSVLYGALLAFDDEESNKVFLLNFCPECNECFISKHYFDEEYYDGYLFDSASPMTHFQHDFSESIKNLSPDFVSIYNESLYAETLELKHICGIGYRKALEFLVKDYAIHKNPSKKEEISKCTLMQCINDYITDSRLNTLAKASTWLGNDETHYVKKHDSYDVNHLKTFLNAFVTFIDADLACEEALNFISK